MKLNKFTISGVVTLIVATIGFMTSLFTLKLLRLILFALLGILGVILYCVGTALKSETDTAKNNYITKKDNQYSNEIIEHKEQIKIFETEDDKSIEKPIMKSVKKEKITYQDLKSNEVIKIYLSTNHCKVPNQYDFFEYKKAEFDCMLHNLHRVEIALSDEKVHRLNTIDFCFENSKNITVRTNLDKIRDFIAIDVETTGLKTGYNDIIEVAAVKFVDFEPREVFSTLLKPRKSIPSEATSINGITDNMVENAPKFSQIKSSLENYIKGYPLVMHNAKFDLKFLNVSGIEFNFDKITIYDTLTLSRRCIKEYDGSRLDSYKLSDVCAEQCIYLNDAHRATADALATGLLFNEIVKIKMEINDLTTI